VEGSDSGASGGEWGAPRTLPDGMMVFGPGFGTECDAGVRRRVQGTGMRRTVRQWNRSVVVFAAGLSWWSWRCAIFLYFGTWTASAHLCSCWKLNGVDRRSPVSLNLSIPTWNNFADCHIRTNSRIVGLRSFGKYIMTESYFSLQKVGSWVHFVLFKLCDVYSRDSSVGIVTRLQAVRGTRWRSQLRHCAASRKVAGSVFWKFSVT